MEHTLESRVAVLEHIAGEADEDHKLVLASIAKHMKDEDAKWETIKLEIQTLNNTVVKYKSFLGGVIFTTSALWGIFLLAIKYFGWFKLNGQ